MVPVLNQKGNEFQFIKGTLTVTWPTNLQPPTQDQWLRRTGLYKVVSIRMLRTLAAEDTS